MFQDSTVSKHYKTNMLPLYFLCFIHFVKQNFAHLIIPDVTAIKKDTGVRSIGDEVIQILFANQKDIRFAYITDEKTDESIVVSNLKDAVVTDFILNEGYLFWADIGLGVIQRAKINQIEQTKTTIISTGIISPNGIACDWIGQNIYWTDSETDRIEVSNIDGNYRKVLYWRGLDKPRAIALDPFKGYMFWTDWGIVPKIERAGMDGSLGTRTIIVEDNIAWSNGLAIDYSDERIYWADARKKYIHSSDFDGTNRLSIIDNNLQHPFGLTIHGDFLYWTDWKTKSIHKCNKHTGTECKEILKDIYSPMDIRVFDASRQPKGEIPCGASNGGCSHLCLISPLSPRYKCACPTGIRLLDDQKTCAKGDAMLLFARRTDLRRVSLDTPDFTDVVLNLVNISHAIALDYDPVEGYVYWTDDKLRNIQRAFLNGTDQTVLIDTEVEQPDGLAVDWIGRNLYWTDAGTDRIEVARLDGTSRKVLVSENLGDPRALCLHPERGIMWWTDWGESERIEMAYLDGSNRRAVIDTDLGWPNGIAVDYVESKIYWCDAKLDRIEVANLDGTERRVLLKDNILHPFGFSLLGTNECAKDNGGCSHLCLFTPEGAKCACPMDLELHSNGKDCIARRSFLYFVNEQNIKRMSILSDSYTVSSVPLEKTENALSMDVNARTNVVYWADSDSLSINRAFINGSSKERIIQFGIKNPVSVAIDWIAENIYWADSETNRIEVARQDGSSRKVLIWEGITSPKAVALDPQNGYMYWINWSKPRKLERAWLDGTHREILPVKLGRVVTLTIDYDDGRLYWADLNKQSIESANMQGEDHRRVVQSDIATPIALAQYQDYIYWADQERHTIEKADKMTGSNRTILQDNVYNVTDLSVYRGSRRLGSNSCQRNNGHCSHLCFALPESSDIKDGHRCGCPSHYTLDTNNRTCSPPKSFLLFSQMTSIRRVITDEENPQSAPDVVLPIQGVDTVNAIDYDQTAGHIYWVDRKSNSIQRAKIDGSAMETVINFPDIEPFDIAFDPYSRVLFYSCSKNNVIQFKHTDWDTQGTVINGTWKPRYIALYPEKGYLFWTSRNTIVRTLFDGSEHVDIIKTNFSTLGSIAIDSETSTLFWVDKENQVIESADFDGRNRKQLYNEKNYDNLAVHRITVFQNHLYWVDTKRKTVGRVEKETGEVLQFVQGTFSRLTDIHAVSYLEPEDLSKHPCARDNGNCSHLCYTNTFKNVQCSCPINLILRSSQLKCTEKIRCSVDQFMCKSGIACISSQWRCDGTPECSDSSDEENCQSIDECLSHPCQNGGSCRDHYGRYTCICASGFVGTSCETETDECLSNPCQNGGTCENIVDGYICKCATSYNGMNCENETDECLSNPCQNGGTCEDIVDGYTCKCATSYNGMNCENDFNVTKEVPQCVLDFLSGSYTDISQEHQNEELELLITIKQNGLDVKSKEIDVIKKAMAHVIKKLVKGNVRERINEE